MFVTTDAKKLYKDTYILYIVYIKKSRVWKSKENGMKKYVQNRIWHNDIKNIINYKKLSINLIFEKCCFKNNTLV